MTPIDALLQFRQETMRFLAAQNVLLAAEVMARNGNADLQDRFDRFAKHGKPIYKDLYEYLCAHLFVAYVSSFEVFLQSVCAFVVRRHPKKLGATQFRLSDVLDAGDSNRLVERAIEEYLNRMMYKKPMEYLDDLCNLLSIERQPLDEGWKVFVEAKARRDLGAHAGWRCNAIYLRKIQEADAISTLKLGDLGVPDTETYLDNVAKSLDKLATDFVDRVIAVHGDGSNEP